MDLRTPPSPAKINAAVDAAAAAYSATGAVQEVVLPAGTIRTPARFDGVAKPNVGHLFPPPTSIPPEEVQKRKGIFVGVAELAASLPPPTPEELAELEHATALEELERNRLEGIEIRSRILHATGELLHEPGPRLVILESPFAGDPVRNPLYARAALRDSLLRGEAPLASHLLYTQPGVLDDTIPEERDRGIEAGLAWGRLAVASVVYVDLGISRGVRLGIERAEKEGRRVEYRSLPEWANAAAAASNAAR
jgi:hypothetical protein